LKTHLSETPLRREDVNNKLNYITREIEELREEYKKLINLIEKNKTIDEKKIDDLNDEIRSEKKQRGDFELIVTTSIKNFKLFISIIVGLLAFFLTIFQIVPYLIKFFN
jgi:chromosome segregation ATPase